MRSLVAEVTDGHCEIASDFALDVEMPRLHVRMVEIRIDIVGREAGRSRDGGGVLERDGAAERTRIRKRRIRRHRSHHVSYRLVGEDGVGCTHRSLSIVEWIPGDTEAWLEVLVVLLIDVVKP